MFREKSTQNFQLKIQYSIHLIYGSNPVHFIDSNCLTLRIHTNDALNIIKRLRNLWIFNGNFGVYFYYFKSTYTFQWH